MNSLKTYEQFNEIDPYGEEIWDENKSNLQFLYDHLTQWLDAFLPKLIDIIKTDDLISIDVNGARTRFFIRFNDNIEVTEIGKKISEKTFNITEIENFARYMSDNILKSMGML